MTADGDEALQLSLVGYVPLAGSGFALPCFATDPRPNAWYLARCSVDGDHAGKVVGFDPYRDEHVHLLPDPLQRPVREGDPWTDVFLWEGRALVGTAVEMFAELGAELPRMQETIPISLLELALAAGEGNVAGRAETARARLERDHGAEAAAEWWTSVIASQVRLAIRRRLAETGTGPEAAREVRQLAMAQREGILVVRLAAAVTAALQDGRLDELRTDLHELGSTLGARINLEADVGQGGRRSPGAEGRSASDPVPSGATSAGLEGSAGPAELRILVACTGERAREISRHVAAPDWTPVRQAWDAGRRWEVRSGRGAAAELTPGRSVIDVVHVEMPPASDDGYDAVVWLVDDELVDRPSFALALLRDSSRRGPGQSSVRLLAPALPVDGPSRLLMSPDSLPASAGWNAVVDTSLARSPFWTGNPWRAIDRRIADILVGSALVGTVDERVREALLKRRADGPPRLLSQAFGQGDPRGGDPELGLMSESSAFGYAKPNESDGFFEFAIKSWGKSAPKLRKGYAALRDADGSFERFAEAVVSSVLLHGPGGSKGGMPPMRRSDAFDWSARGGATAEHGPVESLRTPEASVRVSLNGGPSLVVLGEAPALEAVRSGRDLGLGIARYTDRDTLADILLHRAPERTPLPRELRLSGIRRLESNRGLAVRGVDPRDVVRTRAPASDWLDLASGSDLERLHRGYRARIDALEVEEIVLPRAAVQAGMEAGDPAAKAFAEMGERPVNGAPLKRPSDLAVAWREPEGRDVRRYVLEDGVVPVRMAELPRGVVPAQSMFMLDGDPGVPMLLGSRLFNVWAKATITRSTSWLSRFSVSRTFETFPIPPILDVVGRVGRAELRFRERDGRLADLARFFDAQLDPGEAGLRVARAGVFETGEGTAVWDEINRVLLEVVDLDPGASDIDILDRLLRMNAAGH